MISMKHVHDRLGFCGRHVEVCDEIRALREISPFMAALFTARRILSPSSQAISRTMSTAPASNVATFANGCFWGTEHIFKKHYGKKGLLSSEVGYIGGDTQKYPNPTYEQVCSGRSGYAEAAQFTFDPVCRVLT